MAPTKYLNIVSNNNKTTYLLRTKKIKVSTGQSTITFNKVYFSFCSVTAGQQGFVVLFVVSNDNSWTHDEI